MAYPNKHKHEIQKYGLWWNELWHPADIEIAMIQKGGRYQTRDGRWVGEGLFYHIKQLQSILHPDKVWHKWNDLLLKNFIEHRVIGVMGPASCVAGHTRIVDADTGICRTIRELSESFIAPTVMTVGGPIKASIPFVKGRSRLYEIELNDGSKFQATEDHLVMTSCGFVPVKSLYHGQRILGYVSNLQQSTLESCPSTHALNVQRLSKTTLDFAADCQPCFYSYDEQLLLEEGIDQEQLQQQAYALARSSCLAFSRMDDLDSITGHNHLHQSAFHPSTDCIVCPSNSQETPEFHHVCEGMLSHDAYLSRLRSQLPSMKHLLNSSSEPVPYSCNKHLYEPCTNYKVQHKLVSSIRCVGEDFFYDIQVPVQNHYFAEGAIHHNSGKTREAADFARMVYYCFPDCTTIICTSTELETLEDRVWGEIKSQHRKAREVFDLLPGYLIESRHRLVTDQRQPGDDEGRDFRNGMVCVPTKKGGSYQGMGAFAGRKNKIVILIADEASLLPRIFVDAFANLSKNNSDGSSGNPLFGFKGIALGNPKDTTDALGVICEPSPEYGGWDGGIDQTPETKTWPIRWPDGVCVQLPGTDSPNLDGKLGIPLITQAHIDADIAFYGKDSLQFTMMDQGMMPRGQGSRRVITRQKCLKFHAMEEIVWANQNITKIGFLDAAYRGVGGDRCILGELDMGTGIDKEGKERPMLSLIFTMLVPVNVKIDELPEDQIVLFVIPECERRGIAQEKFYFDSTGRGSLMSAFARHGWPNVKCVEFGGNASDRPVGTDLTGSVTAICKDYYYNFVSELWMSGGLVIESGQLRGLTEDVMGELTLREWGYVGKPVKIQVEPKSEMKKKSGRSPDLADGFVVGVEGARRNGFIIQKLAKFTQKSEDYTWKDKLSKRAQDLHGTGQLNYLA